MPHSLGNPGRQLSPNRFGQKPTGVQRPAWSGTTYTSLGELDKANGGYLLPLETPVSGTTNPSVRAMHQYRRRRV